MNIKAFAAVLLGPIVLLVWRGVYPVGCYSLIIPLAVALVAALGIRETVILRRQCLARCLFQPRSPPYRLLHNTHFVSLGALVVALVLISLLLVEVLAWNHYQLALITVDAPLIVLIYSSLRRAAQPLGLRREVQRLLVKQWTVVLNTLLLVVALLWLTLESPPPDYLDSDSLSRSMANASHVASECTVVDQIASLSMQKEAALWWFMLRGSQQIHNRLLRWLMWLVFLLGGTLSLWGYGRFCVQLIDWVSEDWDDAEQNR